MLLTRWHALAMAGLMAALAGCASTSIGKQNLLDFLQDGTTTREEVMLHLAEPSATFEGGRILTYRLDRDEGGYTLMGTKSARWSGKFSLVLAFDEKGVLRRHALVRVQEMEKP